MATNARQHIDDEELDDFEPIEGVDFVTREEWMEIVDEVSQRRLGIPASEFIAKYRAGAYRADDDQHTSITLLAMMIPADE